MSGGPAQPALDMTLDDLIKQNQKTGGGVGRGSGRGGAGFGPGPSRRFPNRAPNRVTPYSAPKAPEAVWSHDMFASDQAMAYAAQIGAARASSIETGTKLYLSNLDYGVTNEDIKELFAEVGDLKRYTIHYDKSGRSKGTAEVVFSRRQDALAAVKRYNGVQLDGKPMKIEIVGTNIVTPTTALPLPLPLPPPIIRVPIVVNGAFGGVPNGVPISVQGRGRGFGRTRGGGGGGGGGGGRGRGRGFGRGRGRGRDNMERVSADDLDADLDKYHKAAMETN